MDPLKTNALPRVDIADFIKSDRGVRSYEDLQGDTTNVYEAISTSSFLTITGSPSLGSERTLTLTADLSAVDGGPNALYTLGLSSTTVVPGTYGSASKIAGFTVDAKGRLTAATEYALNSDNVTEGATNLFFTNTRARAALSSGTGISYNSGTGAIAVSAKLALYDGGDTPSAFTLGIVDSVDASAWRTAIGAGTSSTTGTVTSVAFSGGTTGLSASGGPITGSGTFTLSGTLAVANGGTGVTASTGTTAVVLSTKPQFTNTIGVGVAANASGAGVSFPATQSASADPNTLDDYEEGTWTPTVTPNAGTGLTATASGAYTKVGNMIVASFDITITANGTGSGYLKVTLPFTNGALRAVGVGTELALSGAIQQVIANASATFVTVYGAAGAYPGGTGAQILGSITYFV